ncbi:MAG: PEGA domain-containing protein [Vicinamibacterales bacterium]
MLPSFATAAQWGYPPMGGWSFAPPESHIRFQVTPEEAEVYIDGYYAGRVDEFNGTFQRLHVPPGQHEIVVYLEGYRSLRQHLYLSVNATRTLEGELQKLPADAPVEPRPEPVQEQSRAEGPDDQFEPPPLPARRGMTPPQRMPPAAPVTPVAPPAPPPASPMPSGAGDTTLATLLVTVQPSGSSVIVDGELWEGPGRNERLIIQLTPGHHRVEVSRKRYETRSVEVDVKAGETHPISVILPRR